MATHDLKIWPDYYRAVQDCSKTFEIRKNDRDYAIGDALVLREWCPIKEVYTGNVTKRFVSYITHGGAFGLDHDVVVLGLEDFRIEKLICDNAYLQYELEGMVQLLSTRSIAEVV